MVSALTLGAALIAGVLTVLSPCVLPILPIVFGAASSRGRFAVAALAAGVATSFVAVGLFVATVGFAIGLDADLFHRIGGALLSAFGLVLLSMRLQAMLETGLAPISGWAASRTSGLEASGLHGQLGLGLLLGAVWSPCVGPTLGAASLLASQGKNLASAGLTMAVFGLGAAAPLILVGSASRAALQRWRGGLSGAGRWGRQLLGIGMAAVGLLAVTGLDRSLEALLVEVSPAWLTRLTARSDEGKAMKLNLNRVLVTSGYKGVGLAAACALAAGAIGAALSPAAAAPAVGPTVVELFTSQGCSSCPPANNTLSALADRPDVLALSFGVTYWDSLGWKDTFASPQYTARQWEYARSLHHAQVWTPQVVVDGHDDTVGQSLNQIEPLIRAARTRRTKEPAIGFRSGQVEIGAGSAPGGPTQVWLVRYDPRVVQVPIQRGENSGRTLPHRNVVHQLIKLGVWTGSATAFALPASPDSAWRRAILIQAGPGGPILAASKA